MKLTEAQFTLVEASGHVAEATGLLLVALRDHATGVCRVCQRHGTHDPLLPCGQLGVAVEALGPAVRACLR